MAPFWGYFEGIAVSPVTLVDLSRSVDDYFDSSLSAWKIQEFQHLLPDHVFAELLAMPPPTPN